MASNFDLTNILGLIADDEDPKFVERFAKKLVEKYPQKAAMLVKKLSLDSEFRDSFITITSAHELTGKQKKLIETIISDKSKHETQVTYLINEELLGGIVIRQGETISDNSLRNRLDQLTEYIKQTKLSVGAENASK